MHKSLGPYEQAVMSAIVLLRNGYGVEIQRKLNDLGSNRSYGALYITLDRLEEKGYVTSTAGGATPERGGRPKRYVRATKEGKRVLNASLGAATRLAGALA